MENEILEETQQLQETKEPKKKKKVGKIIAIVLICLAVLFVIADFGLSIYVYNSEFNVRYETYAPTSFRVSDFEGLQCEEYTFKSNKGLNLAGYLYSVGDDPKGIIVFSHGIGAGHNSYMDCINYFAERGYYVFAYDATASDKSEGDGIGGLPQGVADLDKAISFIEEKYPDLPVGLFGHSWGGYSVCAVLSYHPEVKAVIECSGFCKSSDLLEAGGKSMIGDAIYLMLPCINIYENIVCGDYSSANGLKGVASTDAYIMCVHSRDDKMVGIEYGFDKYYEKYKDDPRFTFIEYTDKGHNYFSINTPYIDEFNETFLEIAENLDYDYTAPENYDKFAEFKAEYITENLDRQEWASRIDEEMFDGFASFYDEHMN